VATVFDPPRQTITDINKEIRRFIFGKTIYSIQHKTLIQDKRQGGISLQDIDKKITSLRTVYVGNAIKNPNKNPFALYYLGLRLTKHIRFDNSTPQHLGLLPPFYKSCLDAIKGHDSIVHAKTHTIYKHLVKEAAPPLTLRIKRGQAYDVRDYASTFTNIHISNITPKAREITYRLIYNMTPTTARAAHRAKVTARCHLCKHYVQETEDHIFYQCKTVKLALGALRTTLSTHRL
jgi:hypothetical protein